MRRFVPKCHIVQFEVCNPVQPAKKPPPMPPPPPPPSGCKVVQNRIEMGCPNVATFPKTMKVPVVLAELELQMCIDVDITLEQPALEIKRVEKDVSLDECKLVPTSRENHFKLFISGFIRKNIEYATARPGSTNASAICGSILHTTAHVPFSCCTEVTFEGKLFPDFFASSESEARFLDKSGRRSKLDQKLFGHSVHYNEQPYCELEAFEINEFDLAKLNASAPLPNIPNERIFITVQEKIVLDLLIKILQRQQIPIPCKHEEECERWECEHDHDDDCCHEKKCKKHKKKCKHDHDNDDECCDHDHEEEEECCDHGHEKKCKKKRRKKCEYDCDEEEECENRWDCEYDHEEEEYCDHGYDVKCKKNEKKFEHDHEEEEECYDHGHEKKCNKKREIKSYDESESKCDHRHKIKSKKKGVGNSIRKYRKKRK
ncbi:hypothetical protein MK805_01850 [Shimazuella sp. AN120528]|uniref:CsxC family protein n=1 Tax=Shimazuella soli TaxID=1892854 RepID=UPI001F0E16DC|nr:hypothetical protein [Shimazuella soli]MCH5583714.1 hypothetical protein [Shimazuella soli]